jgi:hypothetical protein
MKPVRIQFVEPRAWKVIWLVTAVILLSIAGFTGWQVWQQHQIRKGLQVELDRLQAELKARAAPVAPAVNPREASEKAAQRLLHRDWNRLYNAIEHPDLAQVRLRQLTFDAETGDARLEYELENMSQGSAVTAALNAENDSGAWQLERLISAPTNVSSSYPIDAKVRGVWRGRFE